jgi:hypothetical protein
MFVSRGARRRYLTVRGRGRDVFSLNIDNAFRARWAAAMLCSSACHGQPLAGWILARHAFSSYWTESTPEIKRVARRLFRRREDVLAVRAQPSPPVEMVGETWR